MTSSLVLVPPRPRNANPALSTWGYSVKVHNREGRDKQKRSFRPVAHTPNLLWACDTDSFGGCGSIRNSGAAVLVILRLASHCTCLAESVLPVSCDYGIPPGLALIFGYFTLILIVTVTSYAS